MLSHRDKPAFRKILGDLVSGLRNSCDLSQTDLAQKVGVSQVTISRVENGKLVGWEIVERILHSLGLNEDDANCYYLYKKGKKIEDRLLVAQQRLPL